MKKTIKILSLLLSAVMLFSMTVGIDFSAFAASMSLPSSGSCGTNVKYTFDGSTLTISGSGAISDQAFLNANEQTYNVVINDGITSIGSYAFCGSGITDVLIPESVNSISEHAFGYNHAGRSLIILNPKCSIAESGIDGYLSGTIYGYENSTAQTYAQSNDLNFKSIDGYDCSKGIHIENQYPYIGVYYCVFCKRSRCGEYHSWDAGEITKPATCSATGTKTYTCKRCGETETETIDQTEHSYDNGKVTRVATCTENGVKTYTCTECGDTQTETISATGHKVVTAVSTYKKTTGKCITETKTTSSYCRVCNEEMTEPETVVTTEHDYYTSTIKATTSKNGSIVTKCSGCGNQKSKTIIYYPKTVTLSKTSYIYDGKIKKPSVTVKDSNGKKIASSNYTVKYASNKNVGKATVTITFKGNYNGTVSKTFTINPKATTLSSVTANSKGFTVKWKKLTTQTTGYEIQYSTDKNFKKNNKTVTVSKNSTTSKAVSKLTAKKKYYVRIRTYKTVKVNGKSTKIYSSWSSSKAVTTKGTATSTSTVNKTGDIVYITPTGKKYHYSKACAGKNAIKTTLSKAKKTYGPCSKCS